MKGKDISEILHLGGLSPTEVFRAIAQIGLPKGKPKKNKPVFCANCNTSPKSFGVRLSEETIRCLGLPKDYLELWFCSFTCLDSFVFQNKEKK